MRQNGSTAGSLQVVLADYVEALRRQDFDAIAQRLDPGVVWQGVTPDLVCLDRQDVLKTLKGQVRGLSELEALELIESDDQVVLGLRHPALQEVGGVQLGGQIFTLFRVREGKIVSMRDFPRRREALAAAGATDWR